MSPDEKKSNNTIVNIRIWSKSKEILEKLGVFLFVAIALSIYVKYEKDNIDEIKQEITDIRDKSKEIYNNLSQYSNSYEQLTNDISTKLIQNNSIKSLSNLEQIYLDKLIDEIQNITTNTSFNGMQYPNLDIELSTILLNSNFNSLKIIYEKIKHNDESKYKLLKDKILKTVKLILNEPNVYFKIIKYSSVGQNMYIEDGLVAILSSAKRDLVLNVLIFLKEESELNSEYLKEAILNLSKHANIKYKHENIYVYKDITKCAFEGLILKTTFKNKNELVKSFSSKFAKIIFQLDDTRYNILIENILKIQQEKTLKDRIKKYNQLIFNGLRNVLNGDILFNITEL